MGSLLRPKALLDTRHAWEAGKETGTCLRTTEDAAVSGIVKTQIDLGFHGINDGEYRRHMFWGSFWNDLEGMSDVIDPTPDMFRMYIPGIAAYLKLKLRRGEIVVCTGKIKHKGTSTYLPELNYLKSLVPEWRWKEIKLTVAAPNWYHWRYKQGKAYPSEVYHNDDEYFADVAVAYQEELHILYQQGLRNIQFDDPALTCEHSNRFSLLRATFSE